jgi:hypothetical protein
MQLLIPGAGPRAASENGRNSDAVPSLDVRFDVFQRLLRKAIDPECVEDPSTEVPPDVLTGVPLS